MIDFIVRIIMALAGVITGWFVAQDAANFGIIQLVVSVLLIVLCIAGAVFLPSLLALFRGSDGSETSRRD